MNNTEKDAKERLMDAAEELFCQKGFDGTSVRDLTALAKCNIAAINYHFGGKDNLYFEIFRRRMGELRDIRITSINKLMREKGSEATLEDLLLTFANAFLEPLVIRSDGRRLIKLMTREMVDCRLPRNMFIEETIAPVMKALLDALLEVCSGLDKSDAASCIHSLVGQLIHVVRFKEISDEIEDIKIHRPVDLAGQVGHIVAFSAAGIRHFIREDEK